MYITVQARLKPGVDDDLIAFMEKARRARRVGQVVRAALIAYMNQGQRWANVPVPAAPPPPPLPPVSAPPPVVSGGDVLSKAKASFLK